MNTLLAVSVCVIHTVWPKPAVQITPVDRPDPPLSLSDRIITLPALYLDPQTIVSLVCLLHEVQTELFREIKAFINHLNMSGKDERHTVKGEREIKS